MKGWKGIYLRKNMEECNNAIHRRLYTNTVEALTKEKDKAKRSSTSPLVLKLLVHGSGWRQNQGWSWMIKTVINTKPSQICMNSFNSLLHSVVNVKTCDEPNTKRLFNHAYSVITLTTCQMPVRDILYLQNKFVAIGQVKLLLETHKFDEAILYQLFELETQLN